MLGQTPKSLFIALILLLGAVSNAWGAKNCQTHLSLFTPAQSEFLTESYLSSKFHVPEEVKSSLEEAASRLEQRFGGKFLGIVLVGGLANGSYVLRKMELADQPKSLWSRFLPSRVSTDVDFYFLVDGATESELGEMADVVETEFAKIRLTVDGVLNGRDPEKAFDVSKLTEHLKEEDYALLSLPFKFVIGPGVVSAQNAVLQTVRRSSDPEAVWSQIKFYHDSPLALYHGSFDKEFMKAVAQHWLPRKLNSFGLADRNRLFKEPSK